MPKRPDRPLRMVLLMLLPLGGVLYAREALGHKLNVFAVVEGKTIRGEVYFRGGAPAQNAKVEAFDPDGGKLAEVTTDQQGKFSFPVRFRCDHRLSANAGEGHAGEYTVEAGDLPSAILPVPSDPPAAFPAAFPDDADARLKEIIETAVNKQVTPLRRQLDRYGNRLHIRDVLGGIGYILGITGLLFYFLGTRKKGRKAK